MQTEEQSIDPNVSQNETDLNFESEQVNAGNPEAEVIDVKATAEYQEMQSKYQRLLAEFDTFRRRSARESLDLVEQANSKLLGRLTEVLENYERSLSIAVPEGADEYAKGVTMIRDQFLGILREFGLEIMDPQGEAFDPNLHEALMQQPSSEVPADHIVQVFQKGYTVKGKVIRHAKVIVSAG